MSSILSPVNVVVVVTSYPNDRLKIVHDDFISTISYYRHPVTITIFHIFAYLPETLPVEDLLAEILGPRVHPRVYPQQRHPARVVDARHPTVRHNTIRHEDLHVHVVVHQVGQPDVAKDREKGGRLGCFQKAAARGAADSVVSFDFLLIEGAEILL